MSPADLHSLDDAARSLPFALEDYAAANAAFRQWRETGAPGARRDVDVWVYCYVQRYFLLYFIRDQGAVTECDACISQAMRRATRSYDKVRSPDHFASYISKVCKNTLQNHWRDRRTLAELPAEVEDESAPTMARYDGRVARFAITAVIAEMPDAIRPVGECRVLQGMEYDDIADKLGIPVPTVRTYARRVVHRLREDPRDRALR